MYQFTESGLKNVWLRNGYHEHESSFGKVITIDHMDRLLLLIAAHVIAKGGRLSGLEVRFLRHELDISQLELAGLVGVQAQTVSLWERSRQKIPKAPDAVLRALVREQSKSALRLRDLLDSIESPSSSNDDMWQFESRPKKGWALAA
jgi:putative transcriptional regulator